MRHFLTNGSPEVIVIGAGLAGLAAAHYLKRQGVDVLLLEKEKRIGGRVWTREWETPEGNRSMYEQGAQFFSDHFQTIRGLLNELHIPLQRIPFSLQMRVKDHWRSARYDQWGILLNLPGVPWYARATVGRLILESFKKRRKYGNHRDFPLSELGERVHPTVYEYVMAPFYQTLFFTHPDEGSANHFLSHFGSPVKQKIFRPRQGMIQLVNRLAVGLSIITDVSVRKMFHENNLVRLHTEINGVRHEFSAPYVIVAVPGNQLPGLLSERELPEYVMHVLSRVEYSGTAIVSFQVPDQRSSSHFGFSIPPSHDSIIAGGVTNYQNVWHVLLTANAYSLLHQLSEAEMIERTLSELAKFFPGLPTLSIGHQIYRWPAAIPKFPTGYLGQAENLQNRLEDTGSRIQLAGDYLELGCTEGAVRSGIRTGKTVLTRLRHQG